MKKLSKIEFYFENCETASLLAPHVDRICVKGTTKDVEYVAGNLRETRECESIHVKLKKSANELYDSFGRMSENQLFERIAMYDDIVSVTLSYDNGSSDEIRVPYDGEETNDLQETKIDDDGNLEITIARKEDTRRPCIEPLKPNET